MHRILKEKAAQGVDVRLMLDDFGSLMTLPNRFVQSLAADNIRCVRFNPVHKYVSRLYLNYRNHQKIAVIDGNIGYTGGVNLADEYANIYVRYGHWKDTGIRLEGDAVYGLTSTFLQMWEGETGQPQDYGMHRPTRPVRGRGFFSSPLPTGLSTIRKIPLKRPTGRSSRARRIMFISPRRIWLSIT